MNRVQCLMCRVGMVIGLCAATLLVVRASLAAEPGVADTGASQPVTLHVSKLGDNSDGSSWQKAFHTIQAALLAVPDDRGGHRIVIRPDTYVEANLYPAHMGAVGAYNTLVGDVDGTLGSGATGRVIIDSSDPEKGGFKSYDWWGMIRAYKQGWSPAHKDPTFSSAVWDRWILRQLYATASDGAFFWDLVDKPEPFTVVVEDCVGVGRFTGGGVANHLGRADEPVVFRRCHLYCLDWLGDAAAVYLRGSNPCMPDHPDAVFEDCTIVGPDNALQCAADIKPKCPYTLYTRVKFKDCRLIVLNFGQPSSVSCTGIIFCGATGEQLHVDFEDCCLMGYKLFGAQSGNVSYTTKGKVQAYVQFQQEVPDGFERLRLWPAEMFDAIAPPKAGNNPTAATKKEGG